MQEFEDEFTNDLSKVINDMNLNGVSPEEGIKRIKPIVERYKRNT